MTPAEARALGLRYLAAGGKWRDGMLIVWEDGNRPGDDHKAGPGTDLVPVLWWAIAERGGGGASVVIYVTDSDGYDHCMAGLAEPSGWVAALEAAP